MNKTQTATNNPDVITRDEAISLLNDKFESSRKAVIVARRCIEDLQHDLAELEEEFRFASVVVDRLDNGNPLTNEVLKDWLVKLTGESPEVVGDPDDLNALAAATLNASDVKATTALAAFKAAEAYDSYYRAYGKHDAALTEAWHEASAAHEVARKAYLDALRAEFAHR